MPTERILIGGGTSYDNTYVDAKYQPFYKFRTYDSYLIYGNKKFRSGTWIHPYLEEVWYGAIYPTAFFVGMPGPVLINYTTLTNKLVTGILPYQDPYNNCYYNILKDETLNNIYFNFGLPVTLTKYRIWNGFANEVGGPTSTNMGLDTPRSWTLYGSNDEMNWSVVDSRSNQSPLSYATSKLCKNSPYSEYSITSPSAYKTYRLTVTLGAENAGFCSEYWKSGCQSYYYPWQIGEIQFWGYESTSTPCSLHGYDTLFPGASVNKLFGLNKACKEPNVTEGGHPNLSGWEYSRSWTDLDNNVIYQTRKIRADNVPTNNIAISTSVDMGQAITLTSYKINSGGRFTGYSGYYNVDPPKNWTLYASNDNSTWAGIDVRTNQSLSFADYSTLNITSSSPYRYYKFEFKGGDLLGCAKWGCTYKDMVINDIQFIGYI
jgi:hypothetical protein